jgi:hypothetical protein
MVSVVEQTAVPLVMSTLATTVKVLVVSTVELVDTIKHVLGGVTVDYVEQHGNTEAVSGINELLEVFGSSISTASCEEVVDLVSKTGIVGMLHDSHQLNHIVSQVLNSGEHVLGELLVTRNSLVWAGDTDVRLVYTSTCGLLRPSVLELVGLGSWRVPETGIVCGRHGKILCHVLDPSWESIDMFAVGQVKRDLEMRVRNGNSTSG